MEPSQTKERSIWGLIGDTCVYGGGQILSRIITFCLLPLTTHYLNPEDYGVIGQLNVMTLFLTGMLTLGFAVSMSRTWCATENSKEKDALIWTSFFTLLVHCALLVGLGYLFSKTLSTLLFGHSRYHSYVELSLLTLGISSLIVPFQSWLRLQRKALLVTLIALMEVCITIGVALYLIVALQRGCLGQITGVLVGQASVFFLTIALCLPHVSLRTQFKKYLPELIRVGSPYILGMFGYFMLLSNGRFVLQATLGLEESGLYYMGQNFGRVIDLLVTGFLNAWPPFAYAYLNRQHEASHIFGKIFSYYLLAVGGVVVGIFCVARPIVYLMVHPQYHSVWTVVGLSAASQLLWGLYSISAVPFVFYRKTHFQMLLEIAAGFTCLALCFLLCPLFGKEGAAIGTFFTHLFLVFASIALASRLLSIQYEPVRLGKISLGLLTVATVSFLPIEDLTLYTSCVAITFTLFLLYAWTVCLEESEKRRLVQRLQPRFNI